MALTPRGRGVRLVRPEDARPARTAGAVWRAAPPAPADPSPPNKRAGRPKLLEPLDDDADLYAGLQRSKTVLWVFMIVVSTVLFLNSGENPSSRALGGLVVVLGSAFLGCGAGGWNPWRSSRLFP